MVLCKLFGVANLPTIFQVHDLDLLFYCTGRYSQLAANSLLRQNFSFILKNWSMALRYEVAIKTKPDADAFDVALFDPTHGVITFLSQYF